MKQKYLVQKLALLFLTVFIFSCKKEPIAIYECPNEILTTFDDDIFPVLDKNCLNCHSRFDEYSYVLKYVDNNKLMGSIQHIKGYSFMPSDDIKLSDSLITVISCWAQNGALEK